MDKQLLIRFLLWEYFNSEVLALHVGILDKDLQFISNKGNLSLSIFTSWTSDLVLNRLVVERLTLTVDEKEDDGGSLNRRIHGNSGGESLVIEHLGGGTLSSLNIRSSEDLQLLVLESTVLIVESFWSETSLRTRSGKVFVRLELPVGPAGSDMKIRLIEDLLDLSMARY